MHLNKLFFILLFLSSNIFGSVYAESIFDWSSTNIQLLSGDNHELGPDRRNSITIEHADGWKYGENFAFIDIINRHDVGTEFYGEFYPRLNWSKITGQSSSIVFIKDYSIVAGINLASLPKADPFKAYLLGAGIQFNIPKMDYFQIDIFAFKSDNVDTTGIQISPVWSIPFHIGKLDFKFKGFADWQSKKATGGEAVILAQPQLLLDIGKIVSYPDQVYAGIEYSYWRNKFGIKGLTEKVTKVMLMVSF